MRIGSFTVRRMGKDEVDEEKGVVNAVTDGLCCHADHFADGRHAGRRKFDVAQAHLRDQPLSVGYWADAAMAPPFLSALARRYRRDEPAVQI